MKRGVAVLFVVLPALAACSGSDGKTGGTGTGGSGGGTGAGTPMACAITVSSAQAQIQGSTSASGGTCTSTLVNQTTIGIQFKAFDNASNYAIANISCSISPTAGVPQTLHGRNGTTGCNMVIEYDAANAATDMWSDDASSTIDIVVTDIPTASGTINATLDDGMGTSMTVTGTF
ncbi:MAG TPA: hypothetical protein VMT03_13170 [Polyangia bacterium]|nr:hypothetical protein [Polyangia bacterium]